jgi:hypothetical protein
VGSSGTGFLAAGFLVAARFDGVRDDAVRADVDDVERLRVVELLRRRRPGMERGSFSDGWRNRHAATRH